MAKKTTPTPSIQRSTRFFTADTGPIAGNRHQTDELTGVGPNVRITSESNRDLRLTFVAGRTAMGLDVIATPSGAVDFNLDPAPGEPIIIATGECTALLVRTPGPIDGVTPDDNVNQLGSNTYHLPRPQVVPGEAGPRLQPSSLIFRLGHTANAA